MLDQLAVMQVPSIPAPSLALVPVALQVSGKKKPKYCYSPKYPSNWPKVSGIIRSLAHWRCAWCGARNKKRLPGRKRRVVLTVHHIGVPYANGMPGNPGDKHDLRRENLIALCQECHDLAEHGYTQADAFAAKHVRCLCEDQFVPGEVIAC